ncbi:hypothetical protein PRK78_000959 [Emydomyces testavorans]|uniref:Uncharacterized protein n=1 Tax=Emydomyces testavorans TaxID=2070801 RepID=A0AAF0IGC4_9EURO|nr:hypothetical protein PRK78_000959 [Emydomyces testavorans]
MPPRKTRNSSYSLEQSATPQTKNYTTSGAGSATKRKWEDDQVDGYVSVITPTKAKRARTVGQNEYVTVYDASITPTRPQRNSRATRRRCDSDNGVELVREEKRLRAFRKKAPQSYLTKLVRATTQRMFVIKRQREETVEGPEEMVHIVGTTGNVYKVVIGKVPSCSCPDALKGNQCKHIVYVLRNVLKAKDYLQYQLAFLSSELFEIFQDAPLSPADSASKDDQGKRKPVDGDCPICFMEFDSAKDEVVWCKVACGNNIHKTCFQQWAASQKGKEVRCVYCRSPWESDNPDIHSLLETATVSEDGYINVAAAMGMSQERGRHTSLYTSLLPLELF